MLFFHNHSFLHLVEDSHIIRFMTLFSRNMPCLKLITFRLRKEMSKVFQRIPYHFTPDTKAEEFVALLKTNDISARKDTIPQSIPLPRGIKTATRCCYFLLTY